VFELGFWDLISGSGAEEEFESWSSEIEGSLATEKEEMGTAPDEISRISAEKRYIVVALIFLVEGGSTATGRSLNDATFPSPSTGRASRSAGSSPRFHCSIRNVEADAVYLAPGSDEDGLSMEDLHGGGYEYLKMLLWTGHPAWAAIAGFG